jgi:hypothetical protein
MIPKTDPTAIAGGQLLEKDKRVDMLTTQWFLARNTMFSELPRTSAAAAYRSDLGADISMTQGLKPVANEPDDVDNKGVKEARCASCHSTLDPLAYAFTSMKVSPHGFDPQTGEPSKDKTLFEGDVYSLIAHAMGIEFPGRVDFPGVVKG